jgi:hypothetical protein
MVPIKQLPPNLVRHFALVCLMILIAAIFIGGEQPGAGALFPPPWDKVVHMLVYGTMGVLAGLAFPRWTSFSVVLFVVTIGGLDEFHQIFLPGRQAGFDDLFADFIGSLLFLPVLALLRRNLYAAYSYQTNR